MTCESTLEFSATLNEFLTTKNPFPDHHDFVRFVVKSKDCEIKVKTRSAFRGLYNRSYSAVFQLITHEIAIKSHEI